MAYRNLAERLMIVMDLFLGLVLVVSCVELLDFGDSNLDLGDPITVMSIRDEAVTTRRLTESDPDCIVRTASGRPYTGWVREGRDDDLTYLEDGRPIRRLEHSKGVRDNQWRWSWNGKRAELFWEWNDGQEASGLFQNVECVDGDFRFRDPE